jgi:hypothetical protein
MAMAKTVANPVRLKNTKEAQLLCFGRKISRIAIAAHNVKGELTGHPR